VCERTIGWTFVAVQAILLVAAIAARSGSWWKVALAATTIAFFVVKTRWEERRLTERFDEYEAYAATTGRFFPGW
jgi:protein-S-isoprenylcysteine O-methyltransferase Ste14